ERSRDLLSAPTRFRPVRPGPARPPGPLPAGSDRSSGPAAVPARDRPPAGVGAVPVGSRPAGPGGGRGGPRRGATNVPSAESALSGVLRPRPPSVILLPVSVRRPPSGDPPLQGTATAGAMWHDLRRPEAPGCRGPAAPNMTLLIGKALLITGHGLPPGLR